MEFNMKLLKYVVPFLLITLSTVRIEAQFLRENSFDRQLNTRDDQPVREFVESKENIDVKEKSKNLEISGDVRFEWRSIQEKGIVLFLDKDRDYDSSSAIGDDLFKQYRYLRGGDHVDAKGVPISTNDFDVEFNLKIQYTYKDAWAKAHIQFDNPAGIRGRLGCKSIYPVYNENGDLVIKELNNSNRFALKGSGEGMFVNLRRAFIGYNIYADGKNRLDVEIGRQKLGDIFDSEVEFTNRFDGILFRFASAVEEIFDWYLLAGAFVVDERVNHFGYAGEIGFLDIYETGIDFRYNIIDWKKRGKNRCFVTNPLGTDFLNSQVSLTYTFSQTFCKKEIPIELYGGFLVNHAAKKNVFTRNRKKNLAWYAGAYVGNVDKKGDWALDIEYIVIQAQAVPDQDVGSIGRGNLLDDDLVDMVDVPNLRPRYSDLPSSYSSSEIVGFLPRCGNANFIGWRFEFLYAITDNFSIDFIYEFSNEEDKRIGGRHHYRDFEVEAIYAF